MTWSILATRQLHDVAKSLPDSTFGLPKKQQACLPIKVLQTLVPTESHFFRGMMRGTMHLDLSLQLYTMAEEMELALGNLDTVEDYVNQVLDRKEYTEMESLGEAIDYSLAVLTELGYKLSWSRRLELVKTNKTAITTFGKPKGTPNFERKGWDGRHEAIEYRIVDIRIPDTAFVVEHFVCSLNCFWRII